MTDRTAAEDFAVLMRAHLGTEDAQVEPEPRLPRLPAPNFAQGTSDGAVARIDPAQVFEQRLIEITSRNEIRGGWVPLDPDITL